VLLLVDAFLGAQISGAQVSGASTEEITYSAPLLVAAAIVGLAAVAVVATAVVARRPPRIRAAAAGIDPPPEPPAVAGLLEDDFVVPTEIAPAILLDLAARRVVDLEEVQPGRTICRIKDRADERLSSYEAQVLDAIRGKALDGVVPADALTTGTEAQSKGWHRELAKKIVADAQSRGLTYDRWPKRFAALLGSPAMLVGVLLYFALDSGDKGTDDVLAIIAGTVAILSIAVVVTAAARLQSSLAQLPTEAGREAAARVRGFADHLQENQALAELPPAAVKLYQRPFAYAAVFGAAPLAVELLPMGAEDDHRAWSRFGGRWRRVRVRYPRLWPPAWGRHPFAGVALALLWGTISSFVIYGLATVADGDRGTSFTQEQWDLVVTIALVAMIPFAVLLLWAIVVLARCVPDLWRTRTVTGELVRVRRFVSSRSNNREVYRHYIALDDGTADRIRAWRVRDDVWSASGQGTTVTAHVTPLVCYVRSIEPVSGS
jgi:hypothetical protein